MVGKWHLCPTDEMNLASTRRNWPSGRGFERWYGFLGAETNQWYPDLVYDNHLMDQPRTPEEGYHLTDDITDKALEFINDAKAIAPDKPFFLYYAPGACHAPHHAPKDWIEKFRGRFDAGYEAIREQTLARQKDMGIVPADTELPPVNPIGTPEPAPVRTASPGRLSTTRGRGTRSTRTRSACSPGWPRCTPDSWPTPTTTSDACSTTWSRTTSWTTR
jgi:arylsulfatase A-like enzyme